MITAHAIINYSNPQAMRVNGLIKLQLVTIFIDTSSTSTFMDTDTATLLSLLRYEPQSEVTMQDYEIRIDLFLLPLKNYEVVLDIEWLQTLGDV
jgi:hypothetical protein